MTTYALGYLAIGLALAWGCDALKMRRGESPVALGAWLWIALGWPIIATASMLNLTRRKR